MLRWAVYNGPIVHVSANVMSATVQPMRPSVRAVTLLCVLQQDDLLGMSNFQGYNFKERS